MSQLLSILLSVAVFVSALAASAEDDPKPTAAEQARIEALVKQLGHEEYALRLEGNP